jgi:hypothetical protein
MDKKLWSNICVITKVMHVKYGTCPQFFAMCRFHQRENMWSVTLSIYKIALHQLVINKEIIFPIIIKLKTITNNFPENIQTANVTLKWLLEIDSKPLHPQMHAWHYNHYPKSLEKFCLYTSAFYYIYQFLYLTYPTKFL